MKCTVETIVDFPEITIDKVIAAYVGKPHECMCGCSGKYYYTSRNRQEAGEDRGYEVTDDEVNEKQVREILEIIKKSQPAIEAIGDYIFTAYAYGQQYSIYLRKP